MSYLDRIFPLEKAEWFLIPITAIRGDGQLRNGPIAWDGDNAKFVVEDLLPHLNLSMRTRQVIRWAYGYDGSGASYEQRSNGSSVVIDLFMGALLKEPYGVAHDWLYYLHREGIPDPAGHVWTWNEANEWYRDAMREFGYSGRCWVRYIGLTLFSWPAWAGWFGSRPKDPPEDACGQPA